MFHCVALRVWHSFDSCYNHDSSQGHPQKELQREFTPNLKQHTICLKISLLLPAVQGVYIPAGHRCHLQRQQWQIYFRLSIL